MIYAYLFYGLSVVIYNYDKDLSSKDRYQTWGSI